MLVYFPIDLTHMLEKARTGTWVPLLGYLYFQYYALIAAVGQYDWSMEIKRSLFWDFSVNSIRAGMTAGHYD